jgi:hypothetical protein
VILPGAPTHRTGQRRRTLTDLGNAERFVDDHGERVRLTMRAWSRR